DGLNHRAAVQAEALRVIAVLAALRAIEPFAIEKLRAVEEIEAHTIAHTAIQHGHEPVVGMEWNGDAGDRDPPLRHVLLHLTVIRKIDRHLMSLTRHLARQRSYNIGQAARLCERHTLGGRVHNMHSRSAPLHCKCRYFATDDSSTCPESWT